MMADFKIVYGQMNDKERFYFENRLDDQINWYDSKSISSQKKYKKMKTIIIISSALIPFIVAFSDTHFFIKILSAMLSIVIACFEGIININKYQENWIEYRSICETLQHEKYMYLYKSGIYSEGKDEFNYFVERIESIISRENLNWASLNKNEGEDGNE